MNTVASLQNADKRILSDRSLRASSFAASVLFFLHQWDSSASFVVAVTTTDGMRFKMKKHQGQFSSLDFWTIECRGLSHLVQWHRGRREADVVVAGLLPADAPSGAENDRRLHVLSFSSTKG